MASYCRTLPLRVAHHTCLREPALSCDDQMTCTGERDLHTTSRLETGSVSPLITCTDCRVLVSRMLMTRLNEQLQMCLSTSFMQVMRAVCTRMRASGVPAGMAMI